MTEKQFQVITEAQNYVSDLFLTKISKSIRFHTLQHTQEVVIACEKMSDYYQLSGDDRFALSLAAWFHDTGYTGGQAKNHESLSIELATEFLKQHSIEQSVIEKITGCINATRIPQSPVHLIEQIICDADLFHLGTEDFWEKSKLLREELKDFGGMEISKKDWRKLNVEFMESHKYFTSYGLQQLQPLKEVYLSEIKEKVDHDGNADKKNKPEEKKQTEKQIKKDKGNKHSEEEEQKKALELKKKKEKESQSERAIATVFRIMAQNQSVLGQMADTKANILISVNAIILSFVIGSLFDKLIQADTYLQLPVTLLILVCVLAIVFSILATRPNVSSGTFTKEDIANKKTNLLFFGNFHKMNLADYEWGMTEMLGDKVYLYSSMIKDNYFLGVVLAKKYRYLRIAYNIFMFGLIISMLVFAIAFMLPEATDVYTAG